jgi:beta-lysine N6-acetyltransferase
MPDHSYFQVQQMNKGDIIMLAVLDFFNHRLIVKDYRGNILSLLTTCADLIKKHSFSKLIIHSRKEDFFLFVENGFMLEAVIKKYFRGSDVYAVTKYYEQSRSQSHYWIKEDEIMCNVLNLTLLQQELDVPDDLLLKKAAPSDAKALASLYQQVFQIYPTPLHDAGYIESTIKKGNIFYFFEKDQLAVSAASADINKDFYHAELTDCATLPEYRKHGLMKIILLKLEEELKKQHIFCAFSIARALSFGMNAAFYQLGYKYSGRMTNNCYIFDKMEDMNVWVKNLSSVPK